MGTVSTARVRERDLLRTRRSPSASGTPHGCRSGGAREGEAAEDALRRLLAEGDLVIMGLAQEHDPVREESERIAELLDSTPIDISKSFAIVRKFLQDEMMGIAQREALPSEAPEQSLLRLIDAGYERVEKLYQASCITKGIREPEEVLLRRRKSLSDQIGDNIDGDLYQKYLDTFR